MLSDEEINKKMQELVDKIEIICSTNTQFLEKNVILKIRDIDQETLINFVAFCSNLRNLYFKEKEKNKKIEIIVNKLMPLAECSYWNYENHTCSHTCRDCVDLNDINKRTSSGIIIDKDRYCRLYEDGYAEEDTKFVSVEDLIKRHLKEE